MDDPALDAAKKTLSLLPSAPRVPGEAARCHVLGWVPSELPMLFAITLSVVLLSVVPVMIALEAPGDRTFWPLIVPAIGIWVLYVLFRRNVRRGSTYRTGAPAIARVTWVGASGDPYGGRSRGSPSLEWTFETAAGESAKGSMTLRDDSPFRACNVGDPIVVLYRSDLPKRSVPYLD